MKEASQGETRTSRSDRNIKPAAKNTRPEPVNPFQAKLMELKKKFKD
jgi:hypothetical protein